MRVQRRSRLRYVAHRTCSLSGSHALGSGRCCLLLDEFFERHVGFRAHLRVKKLVR